MVPVAIKQKKKAPGKKFRVLAAVLLSLFLAAPLPAPAFADEADPPLAAADEPGNGGEGITPDPPPISDPSIDPPEPPVSSDPPDVPSEPPISSQPWSDPSSEPPEDPSSAPPDEPSSQPPVYDEPAAPVQTPNPTPRRSGSSSISRPQVGRPKLTLNSPGPSSPSASQSAGDSLEPNYITFARLNQRANSMSITLFYGGAASVLLGVIGLIMLLALFIHNRRVDGRDGIFEEIAVAEQRQPEAYPPHQPHAPVPPAPPQPPRQDSLYTEEFAPQQEPVYYDGYEAAPLQDNLYTEEFEIPAKQPPEPYGGYEAPQQDSLYTEEFDIPQESYSAPAQDSLYTEEFQLPQKPQQPTPQKPPAHSAPPAAPHNPYDTEEILRELLGKDPK